MVAVALETGFEMLVALKPVAGVHVYDVPPEAFKVAVPPAQIVKSVPALAAGKGVTETVTISLPVQIPSLTVNV